MRVVSVVKGTDVRLKTEGMYGLKNIEVIINSAAMADSCQCMTKTTTIL